MKIKGIAKGDKDLRHFTFDDNEYVEKEGKYYYKVNYGKNPLEGEGAEDEIGFIECDKVIPLGGQKPKPLPNSKNLETPKTKVTPQVTEVSQPEQKKRGRPAKTTKTSTNDVTIPVSTSVSVPGDPGTFEYTVNQFNIGDLDELTDKLNEMGNQGWEMCGFSPYKSLFGDAHIITVFKRKRG